MGSYITKKIFISSTIFDLKKVRQHIYEVINNQQVLNITFKTVMSEYPETFLMQEKDFKCRTSYETCIDKIKYCDYFALILNKRYNYQPNSLGDISITHKEFREARKHRLPIMVFVNENTFDALNLYNHNKPQLYVNEQHIGIFSFLNEVRKMEEGHSNWITFYKSQNEVAERLFKYLINFDNSKFISATPGTPLLPFGMEYPHEWTLKNTGNVLWQDRYYECMNYAPAQLKPRQQKYYVPDIFPGENFTLKVIYEPCFLEGVYEYYWKMKNKDGTLSFPNKIGLGNSFQVVDSNDYYHFQT